MRQSILIVGGTSGLGRRLAEMYAAEGAQVAVIGRRKQLLNEISHNSAIKTFSFDISQADCNAGIERIIQDLGGIDILIIAASTVEFNPFLDFATEQQTLATNVMGFAAVMNAGYRYFSQKQEGQIVAITSIAAARGNKTAPAYNASKAFQSSYTEGIRLKLRQVAKAVAVTEIIPGYMDTRMAKGDRLFWMAPLDKAARQTKRAIDRKKLRVFVSKRWRLGDVVYRYLPSYLYTTIINSGIKLRQKDQ